MEKVEFRANMITFQTVANFANPTSGKFNECKVSTKLMEFCLLRVVELNYFHYTVLVLAKHRAVYDVGNKHRDVATLRGVYNYDSTSIRRPFDCLSKDD